MRVHQLIHTLATSKLKKVRESQKEMGVMLMGQVRRMLSVVLVRSKADCILSRMISLGRGAAEVNKRRWVM